MAKLETNLSRKDKMTIAVVLFVGVMFCFAWYLIKPAIADIRSLSDDIEQASVIQAQYRNKIINLASSEAIFERAVQDISESTVDYYEIMPSSTIDRMATNYVLSFGLFPEELHITMPSGPVLENPYIYSQLMQSQTNTVTVIEPTPTPVIATTDEESGESDATEQSTVVDSLSVPYNQAKAQATSTASSGVVCADIILVMTGDEAVCQALIDDISTNPSIRIRGFEWLTVNTQQVYNEETQMYEYVIPDYARLRLDLRLYMANVADYNALVSEAVEAAGAEG